MKKYTIYIGLTIGAAAEITVSKNQFKGLKGRDLDKAILQAFPPEYIKSEALKYFDSHIDKGILKALNIEGYTAQDGRGNWNGLTEPVLIITILSGAAITEEMAKLCEGLKPFVYQDSILIEINEVKTIFV